VDQPSLDDALDRLRWAKKHFETIRGQVEPFEQRDTHTISFEVNPDAGEYVFYVHGLEPVDPDWGLMIGDCIHSARAALDYLMVRLWALVTSEDVRNIERVGFPIIVPRIPDPIESEDQVESAFEAARNEFVSTTGKYRKRPVFSGYLARIEQLQPFNQGNVSIWGTNPHGAPLMHALPSALQRLSTLDNVAKHRAIHAAWIGLKTHAVFVGPPGLTPPPDFKSMGSSYTGNALENGAEIARLHFVPPLPGEWNPSEVDMKRHFPLQVAFTEPGLFNGVLEVLSLCLWGVEAVLAIFEPVFTSLQPPLPVTAIPNVE
jgi:hypothetical protein